MRWVGGVVNNADVANVRVRPKPALLRAGVLGTVLVTLALFGSLYLVTIPRGPWALVLSAQLLGSAVAAFWFARYSTTSVQVTSEELVMRTFPHRPQRYPLCAIARVVIADVYIGSTIDSQPQLSALDGRGTLLFRMRGKFWEHADLVRVAGATGAPVTTLERPVTAKELTAELEEG